MTLVFLAWVPLFYGPCDHGADRRGLQKQWITPEHFAEMYAIFKAMPGPGHSDGGVFMERAGTLAPSSRGLCFDPFFSHGLRVAAFLGSVDSGSRWMVALAGVQAAALAVILKSAGDGASTSSTNSRLGVSGLRAAIILWDSRWEPIGIIGAGILLCWTRERRLNPFKRKEFIRFALAASD